MKSKSASEWLKTFGGIFQELTSHGFKPKLQKVDNEASAELKIYFTIINSLIGNVTSPEQL
jgi:hypothetical protein